MNFDFDSINNLQLEDLKKIGNAPLTVRVAVIAAICIIVIFLGTYFLVLPKADGYKKAQKLEHQLRQEFENKQRRVANLAAFEEQLVDMKRTFGTMLKNLPDKAEVENLLIEISRAGSANNLEIKLFKPMGEQPKAFYAEYPIDMQLQGTYAELVGFVSDIAALQRIVTLHDISIVPKPDNRQKGSKDKDKGELNIELVAKTYRYLSDEEKSED